MGGGLPSRPPGKNKLPYLYATHMSVGQHNWEDLVSLLEYPCGIGTCLKYLLLLSEEVPMVKLSKRVLPQECWLNPASVDVKCLIYIFKRRYISSTKIIFNRLGI